MLRAPAVRFDKDGRQLEDSGHGCGCQLCADSKAARYERRASPRSPDGDSWSPMRRRISRVVGALERRRVSV